MLILLSIKPICFARPRGQDKIFTQMLLRNVRSPSFLNRDVVNRNICGGSACIIGFLGHNDMPNLATQPVILVSFFSPHHYQVSNSLGVALESLYNFIFFYLKLGANLRIRRRRYWVTSLSSLTSNYRNEEFWRGLKKIFQSGRKSSKSENNLKEAAMDFIWSFCIWLRFLQDPVLC